MNFEERYPEIFDDHSDVSYPIGWTHILDKVFGLLVWTAKQRHEAMVRDGSIVDFTYPRISQVKEKFGTLRIYADYVTDYQSGIITMAECLSAATCEVCGSPGALRDGNWIRTLCDHHHREDVALTELAHIGQQLNLGY
jgi:hypothetical protein